MTARFEIGQSSGVKRGLGVWSKGFEIQRLTNWRSRSGTGESTSYYGSADGEELTVALVPHRIAECFRIYWASSKTFNLRSCTVIYGYVLFLRDGHTSKCLTLTRPND